MWKGIMRCLSAAGGHQCWRCQQLGMQPLCRASTRHKVHQMRSLHTLLAGGHHSSGNDYRTEDTASEPLPTQLFNVYNVQSATTKIAAQKFSTTRTLNEAAAREALGSPRLWLWETFLVLKIHQYGEAILLLH